MRQRGYQLEPLRPEDIEPIRVWRNAQQDVLRQTEFLTEEAQKTYFTTFVWPYMEAKNPPQVLYSFLHKKKCIGYGGLTHIDWKAKRAELSFLLDPERGADSDIYRKDFLCFLAILCKEAREIWGVRQIFAETFLFRQGHIQVLEEFGFQRIDHLHQRAYKRGGWTDALLHEIEI